jgi:hypothetical protein
MQLVRCFAVHITMEPTRICVRRIPRLLVVVQTHILRLQGNKKTGMTTMNRLGPGSNRCYPAQSLDLFTLMMRRGVNHSATVPSHGVLPLVAVYDK